MVLPILVFALAAPPNPDLPVYRLAVRPAAAPSPALRYKLLPELRDRQSGNAVTLYYKAFSPDWQTYRKQEFQEALDAAVDLPPGELRKSPAAPIARSRMLEAVDDAARRTYIDWELLPGIRKEGIGLLLPDAQGMRSFGQLLAIRARLDVADGKFDKAVYGLQTGFALARHFCQAPTLIHGLIGAAVAHQMFPQIEFLIQQPGAPNLYWALADLPRPLIDLRTAYQGERLFLDWIAPGVRDRVADPTAPPMSPDQLQECMDRLAQIEGNGGSRTPNPVARLALAAMAAQRYPMARAWLMTRGWTAAQIDALPVTQAALMYEVYDYDRHYDEAMKWHTQPPAVAAAGLEEFERQLKREVADQGPASFARLLLPATQKVFQSSLRVDRRIAALQCVEAVRLYAAAHDGRPPAALVDITEVPVPADPATGKPFEYSRRADTAVLTAPATTAATAFSYEVTLVK